MQRNTCVCAPTTSNTKTHRSVFSLRGCYNLLHCTEEAIGVRLTIVSSGQPLRGRPLHPRPPLAWM